MIDSGLAALGGRLSGCNIKPCDQTPHINILNRTERHRGIRTSLKGTNKRQKKTDFAGNKINKITNVILVYKHASDAVSRSVEPYHGYHMHNLSNSFPILEPSLDLRDLKDPCPVFDGRQWHLFGSGGSTTIESWLIFHSTAPAIEGPWMERPLIDLKVPGSGVAAPGVIFDSGYFRMFIQTEFRKAGGGIEYLTSPDGFVWSHVNTALHSIDGTREHGVYDPHPAVIGGERYLVYSGMPEGWPPKPDIYLAKSMSGEWDGPWLRLGAILDHEAVIKHHNQRDSADYEWGIEGAQLIELPDGNILLNATSFLPTGCRGSRQRVFFALASDIRGPYRSLGTVIEPIGFGENGHATAVLEGNDIVLCYQARVKSTEHRWRYGLARFPIDGLKLLDTAGRRTPQTEEPFYTGRLRQDPVTDNA